MNRILFVLCLFSCSEYNVVEPELPEPIIHYPGEPDSTSITDRYSQNDIPKVDVLWVIDNSGSMGTEQDSLVDNFPIFFSYIIRSGFDYHIGVVSTDMFAADQAGKLITTPYGEKWVDENTANPETTFESLALVGTSGSTLEQGVGATYSAFEIQKDYNTGFIRDNSIIHIITVSDESDSTPTTLITSDELINYLNTLRPNDGVKFHSIVDYSAPPEWICYNNSYTYVYITENVGGVFWPICNPDWSGALERLGLEVAGPKREYFLSQKPVIDSVEVTVEDNGYIIGFEVWDETAETGDWIYNATRNSITFMEYIPPAGSIVYIKYTLISSI